MDDVSKPHPSYSWMSREWDLLSDLLGGTLRMRENADKWLPREEKETKAQHNRRVKRTTLFPAFENSVDRLTSKPFSRQVVVQSDSMPERMLLIEVDADGQGTRLTELARHVFYDAVAYGLSHILVDYPNVEETRAGDGTRPILTHIRATDLFWWRFDGTRLVEIRYRALDDNGVDPVFRRYVVDEDKFVEDFKMVDGTLVSVGRDDLKFSGDAVPMQTFYTRKQARMVASPPLRHLAWQNLTHFQSSSEQRNILRVARVPALFTTGLTDAERDSMVIGAQYAWHATSEAASVRWIECTGAAIEAGAADLRQLEEQMERVGLAPATQQSGNATATGRVLDEGSTNTDVQSWTMALEGVLEECYDLAGVWVGEPAPDDLKISIFSDYAVAMRGSVDAAVIVAAAQGPTPIIPRRVAVEELQRRGILSEGLESKEVVAEAQAEAADLGLELFGPPKVTPQELDGEDDDQDDEEN